MLCNHVDCPRFDAEAKCATCVLEPSDEASKVYLNNLRFQQLCAKVPFLFKISGQDKKHFKTAEDLIAFVDSSVASQVVVPGTNSIPEQYSLVKEVKDLRAFIENLTMRASNRMREADKVVSDMKTDAGVSNATEVVKRDLYERAVTLLEEHGLEHIAASCEGNIDELLVACIKQLVSVSADHKTLLDSRTAALSKSSNIR